MTEDHQQPVPEELVEHVPHHKLLELFDELTFKEKFQKVVRGLSAPKETGDYKYAKLQILRLSAPISAAVVPIVAVSLLAVFAGMRPPPPRAIEVQIMEPEAAEELDDIEELMEEPIEPPEPIELDFTPDVVMPDQTDVMAPSPTTEFSPQPAEFDSVAIVKSPVIMKGIYGSRSPGARGSALASYGGSGITEGAVLRALRWLKKNQDEEGWWPKSKHAMTGLALLTFLAHGETPASEEFGATVEKAIRFLVNTQDSQGGWPRRYQHAIATYSICEAYALTKVPMLKEVAEKAIAIIIKGQNADGGWCYQLKPDEPSDTSVMGWCAQALKAAYMAGLEVDGLKQAMRKSVLGFKKNSSPSGGFGYRGPGRGGLTGVGVLCMQLLGAEKELECRNGLMALGDCTFLWEPAKGGGKWNKSYYWYYITQAKFHEGKETWNEWNKKFSPVLVQHQTVLEDAIMGPDGKLKDIGFWDMDEAISGHTDGDVMNTTLSALQLQVYYRYLPTFKKPQPIAEEAELISDDPVEIDITI